MVPAFVQPVGSGCSFQQLSCDIGGRHPGDAARLPQILGPDAGQLLAGFQRQAGQVRIFKISGIRVFSWRATSRIIRSCRAM